MTTDPQDHDHDTPPDRVRDITGRFTRTLTAVRRDAAAAEYRADNPKATYDEIAERFGYSHRSDARKAILRAKADIARPAVVKLIATESEELDALYTEAVAILRRNHITVSHGRIVMWRNPETGEEEPLQDDAPKLQAIRVALDVRKAYQDLHGLKQPAQVAVSGTVRYEVVGVDAADLT